MFSASDDSGRPPFRHRGSMNRRQRFESPAVQRAGAIDQAMVDRRWIDGIHRGDEIAFRDAFLHYQPWLVSIAYGLVASSADAQEIVQEVMLNLWTKRETLSVRQSLVSYLYAAVRKRAISALRRRRVERVWIARVLRSRGAFGPGPTPESLDRLPVESDIAVGELQAAIARAVAKLPGRRRETLILHRVGQITNAQIAELMGVSIRTVDTQLHQAYATLRKELAPWLPTPGRNT
jgi:RNA polymerase sigma-70 factor (ECF subfamily)